ncbi:MAG TPA: tripartite tricarboxylate transporter substrate binding protein [Ramlibacter sp.]|nr:tripartite tricarboxylate transporter substrate binding protein [Ramlibacter sp.]
MSNGTCTITRRTALAALMTPVLGAHAATDFPKQTIRIIAPFNQGAVDILSRLFAERLTAQLGVSVVVEQQTGSGGIIGTNYVTKAAPDGYTLLFTASEPLIMAPLTLRKPPYDPLKELAPVGKIASSPMILVASNSAPFRTAEEMVAYAKKNPGKLAYASSGPGNPDHFNMERLQEILGFQATNIPYKSSAQKTVDTVAGHVLVTLLSLAGAQQFLAQKTLRPLAIGSLKRNASLPDVPTMAELTGKSSFEAGLGYGFFGPARLPADVRDKLYAEIANALTAPQIASSLVTLGSVPHLLNSKDYTGELVKSQIESKALVQRLNLVE